MPHLALSETINSMSISEFINLLNNKNSACYLPETNLRVYTLILDEWLEYFPSSKLPKAVWDQIAIAPDQKHRFLPNGLIIRELHDYETDYLFKEIFIDQVYAKQGILFPEHACVIDVGANIGLFSLFVKSQCHQPKIYAFEPIHSTYEVLQHNYSLYNLGEAYNLGITATDGQQTFTHFINSTVFSGKYATAENDMEKIEAVAQNVIQTAYQELSKEEVTAFSKLLTENRIQTTVELVNTCSLHSFIKQQSLEKIDLLKIDAEGCEQEILSSLADDDWQKIQQIIIEVHPNKEVSTEQIIQLLDTQGFIVSSEQEMLLDATGFVNLYGKKPDVSNQADRPVKKTLSTTLNALEQALLKFTQKSPNRLTLRFQ